MLAADKETQDYLWTIILTLGRINEINRLTWDDVNLEERYVILYTRKKSGGHLTLRKVKMSEKLYGMFSKRYLERDKKVPWIFWHRYWIRTKNDWEAGPYKDRKRIMKILCKKTEIKYFRLHALRHFAATILDQSNIPIGTIQRILGHESRTTTEIYLHNLGDADSNAVDVLESQIFPQSHANSHADKKST
ncbi:MAG: tyrosine-type recombinase/integrase [Deltaproteobacteria bacterium]|nr:tyrosine-type recombinase/integrase [Deltaproteobacteria bacterium]